MLDRIFNRNITLKQISIGVVLLAFFITVVLASPFFLFPSPNEKSSLEINYSQTFITPDGEDYPTDFKYVTYLQLQGYGKDEEVKLSTSKKILYDSEQKESLTVYPIEKRNNTTTLMTTYYSKGTYLATNETYYNSNQTFLSEGWNVSVQEDACYTNNNATELTYGNEDGPIKGYYNFAPGFASATDGLARLSKTETPQGTKYTVKEGFYAQYLDGRPTLVHVKNSEGAMHFDEQNHMVESNVTYTYKMYSGFGSLPILNPFKSVKFNVNITVSTSTSDVEIEEPEWVSKAKSCDK